MADNEHRWYIERTAEGNYAARKAGYQRVCAVADTQDAAIDRARDIDPDATIECVKPVWRY